MPQKYGRQSGRVSPALVAALIILLVPLAAASAAPAGQVREANAGCGGEPLEVESLVVPGKTTLIDFYSPYCPPCMTLGPLLKQLAEKRPDLAVVKVNINRPGVKGIDWGSPLAKQYGIRAVPHFKIYDPQGKLTAEGRNAMSQVERWLREGGLI